MLTLDTSYLRVRQDDLLREAAARHRAEEALAVRPRQRRWRRRLLPKLDLRRPLPTGPRAA
jgi:hypothetical protein